MTVQSTRSAFNTHEDARMHRLRNPVTGQYLHMAADRETPDIGLSWLGYAHQAATLRDRALAAGQPWPYRPAPRQPQQEPVPSFEDGEQLNG